jgi:AcrR family transcriptional regulator
MHAAHDQFDAGLPDETYQEMMESFQQMLDRQAQIFCDALNIDSETASRAVWAFYTAALVILMRLGRGILAQLNANARPCPPTSHTSAMRCDLKRCF